MLLRNVTLTPAPPASDRWICAVSVPGTPDLLTAAHVVYHMAFLGSFPSWLNRTSIIVAIELFTILYALVAGPGIYFLLRARGQGILLWLVIPALTLGFALLVPLYRLALKDAESTLVGVRLIEARAGDDLAVETCDTLVFSGGLEEKRVSMPGEDAVAFAARLAVARDVEAR